MSLALKPWTKATVFAMCALSSAKVGPVVGIFRHLDAGEPRAAALGVIGRDLNLADEREHVRREPVAEQHRGLDFALRGIGFGLVQDGGEGVQHLEKGRNRGLIHRERHGLHRIL